MNIHLKLTDALYRDVTRDLGRPHPFALERIGFVLGRIGTHTDESTIIYLTKYHVIPDEHYIFDRAVGARIGPEAIVWATQAAFHGRPLKEGIFHIHLHSHNGVTAMSATDAREIPKLLPGFRSVGREACHGIIILSLDHGSAWISLPDKTELIAAKSINVIGAPIRIFEQQVTT